MSHPQISLGRPGHRGLRLGAPILLGVLLGIELLVISLLYQHGFEFTCRDMAPAAFCAALSGGVLRAMVLIGVGLVFCLARPEALRRLAAGLRPRPAPAALALQLAGFAAILAPWFFLSDGSDRATFLIAAMLWLAGAGAAVAGTALALAPMPVWSGAARAAGPALFVALGVAAFAPEIAAQFQHAWNEFEPLSRLTFSAVAQLLEALGHEVETRPEIYGIGVREFSVLVGRQCSGIEGFALIAAFLAFYIWLFRADLRFPRVWLLLPLGILLSWALNVLRIAILIEIGARGSPDLAVNGFHSHAGWLMFTLLSVGLAAGAHASGWVRRPAIAAAPARSRAPKPVFLEDPVVAQILPFIVFMGSALLLSTFTELPGLHYPLRAAAMIAVLLVFRRFILALDWRADPIAIGAGLLVGIAWLATAPEAAGSDRALAEALAALSGPMLALWVVARVVGTAVLVPLIEELFFRGYVLRRLDTGGLGMRLLAIAVSSGLFAALHDRWLEAGLAGVIFGLVMLRRGRLSDAVIAHAVANAAIAGAALAKGDWSLI